MRGFDQLDWVHQWGRYEMIMYVRYGEGDADGIYMQALVKTERDGAEEWDILYDRRLTPLSDPLPASPDEAWEEQILRAYFNAHPNLVADEKQLVERAARGEGDL